jgi:nucleoside-diphosphate-sugar epimerase
VATILITGASGVVGRAVAAELADHHVIGLAHCEHDVVEVDEVIPTDLTQPLFGLARSEWEALAGKVDAIVHSAALTEWGKPYELYQALNVDGTARVIELAERASAPVHYVGTCFVRAIEQGGFDALRPGNVVRPYIRSKLAAERLLAESGLPHTIFRPPNLVGDSRTGASLRPQIVQAMSDWICRGKAPYFPLHAGNLVDMVPLDVLAIAVARVVEAGDVGRLYWVTYGETALTAEAAVEILFEHTRSRGGEIARVPIVDPRRGLPIPPSVVAATSRVFVQVLLDVSEVTHACGGVLPSSLPELRERFGVPIPPPGECYRRSLEYWADERAVAG